jgi:hypothetical protein
VKCRCGNGKRKYGIEEERKDICNGEYKKDEMRKYLEGSNLALLSVLKEKEKKVKEIKKKDEEIEKIKEEKDKEIKKR